MLIVTFSWKTYLFIYLSLFIYLFIYLFISPISQTAALIIL